MQHARPSNEMKIQEINHVMMNDAIDEISGNSPEDQPQRHGAESGTGAESRTHQHEHDERDCRHDCQRPIVPMEQAPGRACVMPVNQTKETRHNVNLAFVRHRQKLEHRKLRKLIRGTNDRCDNGDSEVVGPFQARAV